VIVTVCPAMVSVPVRGDVAVFAAIENVTVSSPAPLTPEVIVSQKSWLVAVQLHAAAVVTVALPEPPAAAEPSEVGDTANVQGGGAPAWVTETVWPATMRIPVRGEAAVFGSIENATVPLPIPLTPVVIVSQESLLVAVQLQPAAVVTLALVAPPFAAVLTAIGETAKV
jgi:hypothetical protein